jgi:hypothetical protein
MPDELLDGGETTKGGDGDKYFGIFSSRIGGGDEEENSGDDVRHNTGDGELPARDEQKGKESITTFLF